MQIGFSLPVFRAEIKNIDSALTLSCILQNLIPHCYTLYITLEANEKMNIELQPAGIVGYLLAREFFKKPDHFFKLLGKLNTEGVHKCENYCYGKNYIQNNIQPQSNSFAEPWKWCAAVATHSEIPELGKLSTSPAQLFHVSEEYKNSIDLSTLEKGIVPLVKALNSIDGVCTVYSCEGHTPVIPFMPTLIPMPPFVKFVSGLKEAMLIARIVHSLPLIYRWQVRGRIINQCPTCFPWIFWELTITNKLFLKKLVKEDIKRLSKAVGYIEKRT